MEHIIRVYVWNIKTQENLDVQGFRHLYKIRKMKNKRLTGQ